MLDHHFDTNFVLVEALQSRQDRYRLATTDSVMSRLHKRSHSVDLHILDNDCSKSYKLKIKRKWGAKFQLVPPDFHSRNAAERAIDTFKENFLSIIAGVLYLFPNFFWYQILPQTELTLNLLQQSNIYPSMSAWEHYYGLFNYDANPMGEMGFAS